MTNLSFPQFIATFLQEHLEKPFAEFHFELFDLLSKDLFKGNKKEDKLIVNLPRGHAKSNICSFFFPLWCALTYPKIEILVVSLSEDIAKLPFAKIKKEIENNKWIKAIYGDQQDKNKWSENHIYLTNGSQIRAIGQGAAIRGRRPHIIIADDIESNEIVSSETSRKKLYRWYVDELEPALKPIGKMITVGTILADCSLLNQLFIDDKWTSCKRIKFPALKSDERWTTAIWEKEWPFLRLMDKKRRDPISFAREYMGEPASDDLVIVKQDWVRRVEEVPSYFKAIIVGVDPATSKKTMNDFTALIFLGVTPGNLATDDKEAEPCKIYEIETINQRLHFPELKDLLWQKYKEYKEKGMPLTKIVIEQSMTGIALYQDLFAAHPELHGILEPIGTKNKDKIARLKAVAHYFQNGRVYIKDSDLYYDITRFPGLAHDDRVDALTHGLTKIQEMNLLELEIKKESKYKDLDKEATRFWKAHDKEKREFFEEKPYHKTEEYAYLFGLDM